MNAILAISLLLLSAPADQVHITITPLRTEIVVGEPLIVLVTAKNQGTEAVELSRRRALSTVIFVREKGEREFQYAARGAYYREALEIDGTDAWPPGMAWAWDEWILRRTDPQGVTEGLVFGREGTFEVKLSARLDFALDGGRGWRDSNVVTISVSNSHWKGGGMPPPELDEATRALLHRGVRNESWRADVAALQRLDGVLSDYAGFQIGEFFARMGLFRSLLKPDIEASLEDKETVAKRAVEAYARLTDRCPGLRRRAAFRMIGLATYPTAREFVDFPRLVESFHLAVPVPRQPHDQYDVERMKGLLRHIQILFVPDARLDKVINGTYTNETTWEQFYKDLSKQSRIEIWGQESSRDRPIGNIGKTNVPLRELLFRISNSDCWWELRRGSICSVKEIAATPAPR